MRRNKYELLLLGIFIEVGIVGVFVVAVKSQQKGAVEQG